MIKHIYLVRHGETLYNSEGRVQGGGLDSPLTEKGISQAEALREYFKKNSFSIDHIFSSPLNRSLQTAKIVSSFLDKEIHLDPLLKEISCGEYEGKIISSIDPEMLRRLRVDPFEKYPGGESVDDVKHRGELFLHKLSELAGESVLIFSHGNFLRAFASAATKMNSHFSMKIFLDNTGLSYLFRSGDYFRISLWNSTGHLDKFQYRVVN